MDRIFYWILYLVSLAFQALIEYSHEDIIINELVGIYTSSLLPKTQLAAAHALYLALNRCRDMVHVTNDKNIVQVSQITYWYPILTFCIVILNIFNRDDKNYRFYFTHNYELFIIHYFLICMRFLLLNTNICM